MKLPDYRVLEDVICASLHHGQPHPLTLYSVTQTVLLNTLADGYPGPKARLFTPTLAPSVRGLEVKDCREAVDDELHVSSVGVGKDWQNPEEGEK